VRGKKKQKERSGTSGARKKEEETRSEEKRGRYIDTEREKEILGKGK
jgi:hypothetical protein